MKVLCLIGGIAAILVMAVITAVMVTIVAGNALYKKWDRGD